AKGKAISLLWPSTHPASAKPWRNATTADADSSGDLLLMNPITGVAGCCARAASGHTIAAPPSSVMNWRRFMWPPAELAGNITQLLRCWGAETRRKKREAAKQSASRHQMAIALTSVRCRILEAIGAKRTNDQDFCTGSVVGLGIPLSFLTLPMWWYVLQGI